MIKAIVSAMFVFACANVYADDPTPAEPVDPAKPVCQAQADGLLAKVIESGTLKGDFMTRGADFVNKTIPLPDGATEIQEVFTYHNSAGDNTAEVTLAGQLCELRSVVHNVPM